MLGSHVLVDMYGISNHDMIDDNTKLFSLFKEAIDISGATYVSHKFSPQGVSGAIIISESHLTWHTWPELNFLSFDYFMCGDHVRIDIAVDHITEKLCPEKIDKNIYVRGAYFPSAAISG